MANIKSVAKRARQAEVRHLRNKAVKTSLKTYAKRVRVAVQAGDKVQAEAELQSFSSKLDKAAKRGVIHKNQAGRRAGRLQLAINKMGVTAGDAATASAA